MNINKETMAELVRNGAHLKAGRASALHGLRVQVATENGYHWRENLRLNREISIIPNSYRESDRTKEVGREMKLWMVFEDGSETPSKIIYENVRRVTGAEYDEIFKIDILPSLKEGDS